MKDWKANTIKTLFACVLCAGVAAVSLPQQSLAQGDGTVPGPDEYGIIIDEALDEIEQDLDPSMPADEVSAQTEAPEASELTGGADDMAGPPGPAVTVEIPEIGLTAPVEGGEKIPDEGLAGETPQDAENNLTGPAGLDRNGEIKGPGTQEPLKVKVIPLLHAEASGLIETLEGMKGPSGAVDYDEENRTLILKDTAERLETMQAFIEETDVALETQMFVPQHVMPGEILEAVKKILTENIGQARLDEESGGIIVTDTPVKVLAVGELITALDRVNKDAVITARVFQIILNDEHPDGVDWEAIVSDYRKAAFPASSGGSGSRSLSLGTISQEDLDILLEALDTVGVVRRISEDKVTIENQKEKDISVPLSEIKNIDLDDESPDDDPDYADLGFSDSGAGGEKAHFFLTPNIEKDNTVSVSVRPELLKEASLGAENAADSVTVRVKDGETIVIGSLFEEVAVASEWKIPLLGDLPLLGFVFRNEGEEIRPSEVITFMTVTTVKKDYAQD